MREIVEIDAVQVDVNSQIALNIQLKIIPRARIEYELVSNSALRSTLTIIMSYLRNANGVIVSIKMP